MFTGIVEEMGRIRSIRRGSQSCSLSITAKVVLEGTQIGDSICTNGVCLTVTKLFEDGFEVDVMPETMRKSNLQELMVGSSVHLERAATLSSLLGGHLVSGHIDGVGTICKIQQEENATWLTIRAESSLLKYMIYKGSIAIDGVSLTIAEVGYQDFKISLIPHTCQKTHLLHKQLGDTVNLECDVIGKYVERFLTGEQKMEVSHEETISKAFLAEHCFL